MPFAGAKVDEQQQKDEQQRAAVRVILLAMTLLTAVESNRILTDMGGRRKAPMRTKHRAIADAAWKV